MRRNLIVGFVLSVLVGALVLLPRSPGLSTKVSVSFAAYTNDHWAVFQVHNRTTNQLLCAAGEIQLHKSNLWVADTHRVRRVPTPILEAGTSVSLFVPMDRPTNAWRCRILVTDLTNIQRRPWL